MEWPTGVPGPHHTPEWPHLLLVVGDDAADEVGVGVPQRGHELGQLLLVQHMTCMRRSFSIHTRTHAQRERKRDRLVKTR